ncbi:MAG: hypothetical protein AABY22_15415 [Nanoarchaeota archaeon]
MITSIQVNEKTKDKLEHLKIHHRETYNEVIEKLISLLIKSKRKNQYDEFLHKIQQQKMKELWDNKEDEAWENA